MDIEARIREIVAEELDRRAQQAAKPDPAQILRVSDIARQYGYSTEAVSEWCRTGQIRGAFRPGRGHWRFTRAAFDAFLSGRRSTRKAA